MCMRYNTTSETRVYICPTGIYGRYVRIHHALNYQEYLQLCEVQIFAPVSNTTNCRWTGLACTAGKPQELTELSGEIGSPTLYNIGNYPPNLSCLWKITVPECVVSVFEKLNSQYDEKYKK